MGGHGDGIQIEQSVLPWERPGCFRLDCEPHRGEMLTGMAILGLVLSTTAMCLPPLLVFAMPLNLATWYLARCDLAKIAKGRMDPDGEERTAESQRTARFALALGIIWATVWATLLLAFGG